MLNFVFHSISFNLGESMIISLPVPLVLTVFYVHSDCILLLLCDDVESNPGLLNNTVKCVYSSCDKSGLMVHCEMCSL